MTAFDNIKANNWPSESNDLEDFLVLELPLNDDAALTSSRRDIVAGSKVLFPKRTLTNTGVASEAAGSSHALTFRGGTSPTNHLNDNTQTSAAFWSNTDHYDSNDAANTSFADWVFDPPLENVTSIEVNSRHDNQHFNPYYYQVYDENDAALVASPTDKTGSGTGNYTSIYSGSATTVKRIKQYGGAGFDDFYGLKVNGTILNTSNGISGLTAVGSTGATATYSIGTPRKHYDNNASFNGSSVIDALASSDYAFSGDFTIEFWVNTSVKTADGVYRRMFVLDGPTGDTGTNLSLNIDASSGHVIAWGGNAGPGAIVNQGVNIADGAWHHVACVRQGTSVSIYVDGSIQGTGTDSRSLFAGSTPAPRLGGASTSTGRMNGSMQDVRIYKGVAKYTSNFTPPGAILG